MILSMNIVNIYLLINFPKYHDNYILKYIYILLKILVYISVKYINVY